ncbi:MAG: response regulator transcription factor [Thermomicrobiales bacterium]|jgi:two-component system OmpR family response regulator|nr:response regulator transcription factor [Thermomicrobiales bacterium]
MLNSKEPRTERILVVEDEDAIRELVATALRFTGFDVETAAAGAEALSAARNGTFDLLVMDVNLPDIDGFTICRKLRDDGNHASVIFLTARDDPADLRTGFLGGGDDYVTKPFSLEELMLRIDAVLRRSKRSDAGPSRLVCGEVSLDEDAHRVWVGDEEAFLSPTEFRLLRYLLVNKDRVVSKNQILEHVWDYDFAGDQSAVETYISYLRRKLGDRDAEIISTVRGFGYSMRTPVERRQAS